FDERHVPPRGGPQVLGVVVGHPGEVQSVLGQQVPLLAGHFTGLAPDADAGVGEEADALGVVRRVAGLPRRIRQRSAQPVLRHRSPPSVQCGLSRCSVPVNSVIPARRRYSSTYCRSAGPRGRRPGWMSQVPALLSMLCTLGSRDTLISALAAPPVVSPFGPQCQGSPIWCTVRPPTCKGRMRCVTSTLPSIALRAVMTVAQSMCLSPRSAASSGDTSTNIAGASSDRWCSQRLMPPAVWCSVIRNVVNTYGNTSLPGSSPLGW